MKFTEENKKSNGSMKVRVAVSEIGQSKRMATSVAVFRHALLLGIVGFATCPASMQQVRDTWIPNAIRTNCYLYRWSRNRRKAKENAR